MSETLKPIKAKMLQCGEVEVDGENRENVLVLEAADSNWRVRGGTYYVIPEAAWDADREAEAKARVERRFGQRPYTSAGIGTVHAAHRTMRSVRAMPDHESDKHERVAELLMDCTPMRYDSRGARKADITAILRREYGDERLQALEEAIIDIYSLPNSPLGEGKAAALLGVDIITLNMRVAAIRKLKEEARE